MKRLRDYASKGDIKVVENTTFTSARTYTGYGAEYKDEYQRLLSDNQYDHIVFTIRENIPDINPLPKPHNLHKYIDSLTQLIQLN